MAGYLEQSLEKIKEFEGSVPWMYLDTVGKVTVGVGLMLANEIAAHALPFAAETGPATRDEVAQEFSRVSAMKKGQLARFYFSKQGLHLTDEIIDGKLRETLEGFEGYLRSYLKGYDALPDSAKLALLDMIYNLGPGRLFAEYPRFIAAVERGDWRTAANTSQRRGPSAARNAWTKQQLLAAESIAVIKAEAEQAFGGVLLFMISGLAALAAAAILFGEIDRLAARIRDHRKL